MGHAKVAPNRPVEQAIILDAMNGIDAQRQRHCLPQRSCAIEAGRTRWPDGSRQYGKKNLPVRSTLADTFIRAEIMKIRLRSGVAVGIGASKEFARKRNLGDDRQNQVLIKLVRTLDK